MGFRRLTNPWELCISLASFKFSKGSMSTVKVRDRCNKDGGHAALQASCPSSDSVVQPGKSGSSPPGLGHMAHLPQGLSSQQNCLYPNCLRKQFCWLVSSWFLSSLFFWPFLSSYFYCSQMSTTRRKERGKLKQGLYWEKLEESRVKSLIIIKMILRVSTAFNPKQMHCI